MSDQSNSEYFMTRAAEALKMSEAAEDARAAAVHAEMAVRYAALAKEFERPKLQLVATGTQ